jgi:hypothetical protein
MIGLRGLLESSVIVVLTVKRYLLYNIQQNTFLKEDPQECLDYAMTASLQIFSSSYSSLISSFNIIQYRY